MLKIVLLIKKLFKPPPFHIDTEFREYREFRAGEMDWNRVKIWIYRNN